MLTGLVLAILLAGAPGATAPPAMAPSLRPGTAQDVLAAVNAAKGKVVLVNAWATWCLPCREEMPDLLKLRAELREKGFELVLVSTDFEEDVPAARKFLGETGVDFETFRKKQRDPEFIEGLDPDWSGALPFSVIFDRDGRRAASWTGKRSAKELRDSITQHLATTGEIR